MGKRVFNTYHASAAEIHGVKTALAAAHIPHYETHKGKWGVGSAALWATDPADYPAARAAIDEFQHQWAAQVRQQATPTTINWAKLPALLATIAVVLYLTLFWYF